MRLFRRRPKWDIYEDARPELWAKAAANPRLAALLQEVERGRARRDHDATEPLHAHEITSDDAAMIRMMAGAHFGPDVTVTLPSGRRITGAEMARWVEENQ